ncbi:hypothetical protein pipiens_003764 [Culex pipiens pipiens]|uniref:Uncharacterized protein n=1 Tax=Culex pipiens pipiens TaxID=38569 RepID=A0ABD1CT73_CULPP
MQPPRLATRQQRDHDMTMTIISKTFRRRRLLPWTAARKLQELEQQLNRLWIRSRSRIFLASQLFLLEMAQLVAGGQIILSHLQKVG